MAQLFDRSANAIMRAIVLGLVVLVGGGIAALVALDLSSYTTEVGIAKAQPVPFSHKHHVQDLKLDCRYCHASVEKAAFAGLPSTDTCMSCHSQIWTNSPLLQPVRDSFTKGQPLVWNRVYDLPNFVYFNHSIHVNKGVGCSTCHGRVDQMQLTYKQQQPYMGWCLGCHRQPELNVRPRDQVFNMEWVPPTNQLEVGTQLVAEYHIKVKNLTDCAICHR